MYFSSRPLGSGGGGFRDAREARSTGEVDAGRGARRGRHIAGIATGEVNQVRGMRGKGRGGGEPRPHRPSTKY